MSIKTLETYLLAPQKVAIWLLVVTMGCGTVGVTVISPALSSVSEYFKVERSSSQLLLTVYFGSFFSTYLWTTFRSLWQEASPFVWPKYFSPWRFIGLCSRIFRNFDICKSFPGHGCCLHIFYRQSNYLRFLWT